MGPDDKLAFEAYMLSRAKEKREIIIWDFRGQESNLPRDGKANVW